MKIITNTEQLHTNIIHRPLGCSVTVAFFKEETGSTQGEVLSAGSGASQPINTCVVQQVKDLSHMLRPGDRKVLKR